MNTLLGWVLVTFTLHGNPILQMEEATASHLYKRQDACVRDAEITRGFDVEAYCMEVRGKK